ncbi:MAG: hypothetical protein HQL15_04670 [Candidatus Omnitrophica bacterium]|nr:hypothetical protein [Candidatus Omnitrophota bacterium]
MARRMMFERAREPILPHHLFLQRMMYCAFLSFAFLLISIVFGAVGYHFLERIDWLDSFLNSVMIMMGLGLESPLTTSNGKLFTIVFSVLSPFVFYSTIVIFFTPILHRLLHHFHLDLDKDKD